MKDEMTLVQASPETRSWLQNLRGRLSHLEYIETKYWAKFTSEASHKVSAYLNPTKRSIRLFLPLDPSDDPHLQPSPSTGTWGERFCSVFRITGKNDLPTAARLIAKASD